MRKQVLFGIVTAALVIILAGSNSGVAFGKPRHNVSTDSREYLQLEEIYVDQVRELLEQEGIGSAGVTLTYERDRDGSRHYTLLVHHHRLAGFEQKALSRLTEEIEACFFADESCSVDADLIWSM